MSGDWEVIEPDASHGRGKSSVRGPLSFAVSSGSGSQRRRVTLTFYPTSFTGIDWLVAGNAAGVMLGRGEFLGRVRIAPKGRMRFSKSTSPAMSLVALNLPELMTRLVVAPGRRAQFLDADWAPDWIEFELPDWAKLRTAENLVTGPSLASAIASTPPVAAAAQKPFVGALAGGVEGAMPARAPIPLTGGLRP